MIPIYFTQPISGFSEDELKESKISKALTLLDSKWIWDVSPGDEISAYALRCVGKFLQVIENRQPKNTPATISIRYVCAGGAEFDKVFLANTFIKKRLDSGEDSSQPARDECINDMTEVETDELYIKNSLPITLDQKKVNEMYVDFKKAYLDANSFPELLDSLFKVVECASVIDDKTVKSEALNFVVTLIHRGREALLKDEFFKMSVYPYLMYKCGILTTLDDDKIKFFEEAIRCTKGAYAEATFALLRLFDSKKDPRSIFLRSQLMTLDTDHLRLKDCLWARNQRRILKHSRFEYLMDYLKERGITASEYFKELGENSEEIKPIEK